MKTDKNTKKVHTFSENDSAVNNYFKNKSREAQQPSFQKSAQSISAEQELVMKRKRSIVLTIATKTGIKEVNDFKKFNAWMKKSSILKKDLHAYSYEELDDLIKQLRALESNYENSASKTGSKAWHHATGIPKPSQN
ncbi:MAG: hypothetical protein ACOVLC_06135 [Flavobacterium sp.]|jgi:hypothetical protein